MVFIITIAVLATGNFVIFIKGKVCNVQALQTITISSMRRHYRMIIIADTWAVKLLSFVSFISGNIFALNNKCNFPSEVM